MIAYGGNGAVHAWAIARELGIDRVLVPKAAPAFSALGVLVADYVVDLVRAYVVPLSQVDVGRVRTLMHELQDEADQGARAHGARRGRDRRRPVRADVLPGPELRHERPRARGPRASTSRRCSISPSASTTSTRPSAASRSATSSRSCEECASSSRGRTPKPEHLAEVGTLAHADDARTGTRPAYFGDGFVDAAVYDGSRLGAGAEVHGPALVEEPFTVLVVPPGARAPASTTPGTTT